MLVSLLHAGRIFDGTTIRLNNEAHAPVPTLLFNLWMMANKSFSPSAIYLLNEDKISHLLEIT